jgi:hypothetical protein
VRTLPNGTTKSHVHLSWRLRLVAMSWKIRPDWRTGSRQLKRFEVFERNFSMSSAIRPNSHAFKS